MGDDIDRTGLADAVLTDHALAQMGRRRISMAEVQGVLRAPKDVLQARPGRVVAQSVVTGPEGRPCLLRVFVDVDRRPAEVVTAYRTTKLERYRSRP